jgi:flagellar hook-length control protein FliK
MDKARLQHLDVDSIALPHQRLRSTVMQLAKPVSASLQQALVAPSTAASLSTSATTTPFAALLESHHDGQQTSSVKKNPAGPTEDSSSAQQAPSKTPSSDRTAERQLERNRLNAQREAKQTTNRPATTAPPNKDAAQSPARVSEHSMQETAAQEESTATADTDKDKKATDDEPDFNPLTLLQWITDQAAQEIAASSADKGDKGGELAAPTGAFSSWHTIKTAADNPAAGVSNSMGDKTPGARAGLTGKVSLASGLLAPPSQANEKQEPTRQESRQETSNPNALGVSNALTASAIGLEGWSRAMASPAPDIPGTIPGAVQKAAPSAATTEVNNTPQAFALDARNSALADSAAVSVNLPAPVQSPEFRELLGSQISLLAKDGVQSAELHLNPAEMGPVSVQITLDGTQARVDFGADSAQTRQFIEASLPELASALRDAGLTLSGGGVSQHAHGRENQQDSRGTGTRSNSALGEDTGDAVQRQPVSTRRVALGGVDLYA